MFGLLERTPIVGDTVEAYGYSFEVIQMQGYRISRVRVVPVPVEEAVNEDDQQES
ncbi:transporter associated domain-containing protein [Veillonella caviae]|uniref:transporter associated domain-containing protein n=1 Tax=Veillonella caviae TaxID=248316 RepID=UPI0023F8208E|nr:transporter associated domain-containing protein [Veillonella caviae]